MVRVGGVGRTGGLTSPTRVPAGSRVAVRAMVTNMRKMTLGQAAHKPYASQAKDSATGEGGVAEGQGSREEWCVWWVLTACMTRLGQGL